MTEDDDLVKRLRHLVSLNEPKNGGPYAGLAAEACVLAMREAADALDFLREQPKGSPALQAVDEKALLPCPFCGNERPFWDHSGPVHWQVCCNGIDCQASTLLADTKEQAIERWNRRLPSGGEVKPPGDLASFADALSVQLFRWREIEIEGRLLMDPLRDAMLSSASTVPAEKEGPTTEWIEWNGGTCPVGPDDLVYYRMRAAADGKECGPATSTGLEWKHWDHPADVIAYRLASTPPETGE